MRKVLEEKLQGAAPLKQLTLRHPQDHQNLISIGKAVVIFYFIYREVVNSYFRHRIVV